MATKSMAYDHEAYTTPHYFDGSIAAAASSATNRFVAPTGIILRGVMATVVTAGGTANTIDVLRMAAGGTALTTMATIANVIGTAVGGVTTYATFTHATASSGLTQGDVVWAAKGSADGTGVYAVTIEYTLVPGANVTA